MSEFRSHEHPVLQSCISQHYLESLQALDRDKLFLALKKNKEYENASDDILEMLIVADVITDVMTASSRELRARAAVQADIRVAIPGEVLLDYDLRNIRAVPAAENIDPAAIAKLKASVPAVAIMNMSLGFYAPGSAIGDLTMGNHEEMTVFRENEKKFLVSIVPILSHQLNQEDAAGVTAMVGQMSKGFLRPLMPIALSREDLEIFTKHAESIQIKLNGAWHQSSKSEIARLWARAQREPLPAPQYAASRAHRLS